MRRSADAQARETQRVEMLRQQMLTQQRATASRTNLAALVAASHRKSVKHRHHVDESEIKAHDQARRDARHELRALESMGPAQILCEALNEAADEILESTFEMVAEDCLESAGELADDFIHLVHLD